MLKKKMLIALGMAAVLSVGCVSATVWAEENAEKQTEEQRTVLIPKKRKMLIQKSLTIRRSKRDTPQN